MRRIIEEKPFPTNLEDRLASVANAINTELKIATLLHLDDTPTEVREIKARVRETTGKGYLPQVNAFRDYGNTLHNLALVARETIVRDTGKIEHIGYSLTDAGRVYGLPSAIMSLQYAVNNEISMFQILGSTVSGGESRAPYNRMRILHELSNSKELQEADLVELMSLNDASIKKHLEALAKIGFVAFDSVGAKKKGKFTYEWVRGKSPDEVKTVQRWTNLTRRVAEYMANSDIEADYNTLSEMLEHRHQSDVSLILSGLEKQGLVRRTSSWKSRIQSTTRILYKGRKYHDESYPPLVEFLSDKSLDLYQEKVITFRSSKQFLYYVKGGVELYRKVSPMINKKSQRERKEEIKQLLVNSQGLTSKEIAGTLNISSMMVRRYISQLGGVKQKKEGHELKYYIDGE